MKIRHLQLIFALVAITSTIEAQETTDDERQTLQNTDIQYKSMNNTVLEHMNNGSAFGAFHDNYFIVGIPTNHKPTCDNSDVKFHVSVRQMLTRNRLPLNTALLLTYSQSSFWTIFAESSPFKDNNYNPTLTFATPIFKDNYFRGLVLLAIEHESNGRDGEDSRSWNFFSLRCHYFLSQNWLASVSLWAGWVDKEGNPDLMSYKGYGHGQVTYYANNDRFSASIILAPRNRFGSFNTTVGVNFKLTKNDNQFVFMQFYNGYCENLLNYNEFRSMLRIGLCIKPDMRPSWRNTPIY